MSDRPRVIVRSDAWAELRRFTPARIALGRAGASLPTAEVLRFGLAHAQARDAVHAALDADALERELLGMGHSVLRVRSAALDRATYLVRPDLGRRLCEASAASLAARTSAASGLLWVAADGLSATAVERHLPPLLREVEALDPAWRGAPAVIATQGRVALGDEVGERLGAEIVVVAIGERPGLSSPDSLGLYVTYAPRRGRTDAERNCISNVRPAGLGYRAAANLLEEVVREARRRRLTGVAQVGGRPGLLP